MMYAVDVVKQDTFTVAVVHDCQMLDEDLRPEEFDTVCALIVTPSRTTEVGRTKTPSCGIIWEKLQKTMLTDVSPLQEPMRKTLHNQNEEEERMLEFWSRNMHS